MARLHLKEHHILIWGTGAPPPLPPWNYKSSEQGSVHSLKPRFEVLLADATDMSFMA